MIFDQHTTTGLWYNGICLTTTHTTCRCCSDIYLYHPSDDIAHDLIPENIFICVSMCISIYLSVIVYLSIYLFVYVVYLYIFNFLIERDIHMVMVSWI